MPLTFRLILTALLAWTCCFPGSAAAGQPFRLVPWQILQTRFTILKYKTSQDLIRFHSSVRFGPRKWNRSLELEDITQEQVEDMVIKKVDAIFIQAQEILDMKKRFDPVNIHVHSDTQSLKKAYESIYSGECRLRAWYRYRTNTIYLNSRDLHQGILAHELAHAIIDHYLTVKPPPQTAEILARYVDTHLDRGFVQ